jgi:hypothetical protein
LRPAIELELVFGHGDGPISISMAKYVGCGAAENRQLRLSRVEARIPEQPKHLYWLARVSDRFDSTHGADTFMHSSLGLWIQL